MCFVLHANDAIAPARVGISAKARIDRYEACEDELTTGAAALRFVSAELRANRKCS